MGFSDDSETWLVDLTEPTGPPLDSWADRTVVEPILADPSNGIESQLTWIYEELIGLWRDSSDLAALGMGDVAVDPTHVELTPSTATDITGAAMADGAEDERREFESTSADATGQIVSAARDAASQLWSGAFNSEFAAKVYMVTGIGIDGWIELDGIDLDWFDLDWFDLGNTICEEWDNLLVPCPVDEAAAIEAAVDDLDLAGSVIPEACG